MTRFAPYTLTMTYQGVVITLTPPPPAPPPPPAGTMTAMILRLPMWTASFTLPGATAAQSVTARDPASALSAAQTAIDAALNPTPAAPAFSLPMAAAFMTPGAAAASAPAPAGPVITLKAPQPLPSSTYRGVTITFAQAAGKIVAMFTPPGGGPLQSTSPQPTYAGALTAAQGTIDQDIMASGG